ncbi:streptophobe family protein [Streptomyces sp. G-G2]|uniref:streptophobe family protein n=1 Tax=Streptomyces sp. G-G2 TaxID=3046201 RepID=UPI0024B8CBBF|nr:streptophobe family protein [Streptomyces sp. G-G2]MDJ0381229.1 streptophobe family protein [Streptomyces sp. G-G2]
MSRTSRGSERVWRDALVAVVAGFVAMTAVAAAGLACAGADGLPGGAFPHVVAAVVVMASGGSVSVTGGAGFLAGAHAGLSVMPLSVSLAGALATAFCFVRPLRHHAVATPRELLARAGPLVVVWLVALTGFALLAGHTFGISTGDSSSPVGEIGELLDSAPTVGFRADLPATLGLGLLWILGLLVIALLVSRRTPLPARLVRFHAAVRPAAFAVVALLLSYVVLAALAGVVVAATQGHARQTLAVVLLGLPNLAWLALSLGLGGSWQGRVEGPFGLPMPQVLDQVLRTPDLSTVDVRTLAGQDARAWWLVAVAAVLLLGAGFVTAVRSPAHVRPWQHALHLGVALALATLTVCLLGGVEARFGLSLLGIGDVDGLGGTVELLPRLLRTVAPALLWGAVTGFLGALLAAPVHRRGRVESPAPPR